MRGKVLSKRDIPAWIGLVFCVIMLILEVLTGRDDLLILLNAGLIFTIGFHIGSTNAKISEINGRIERIEEDIGEIRKDVKEIVKRRDDERK